MYHIIINSTSVTGKRARLVDDVKGVFKKAGRRYTIHMTEYSGHAKVIAEKITANGEHCKLVAMGGDGTLHEVLNGIKYPEKCSLGLIPVGTGNDFAEAVHLPGDVIHAAQIIAFKQPYPIDYIQLTGGVRSINAVGMGLDCDVLKKAYSGKSKSKMKYLTAVIYCLMHFKSYKFVSEIDGDVSEHYGLMTCLGNGRQIGGGIKLFPNYSVNDGYIEVMMVDFISKRRAVIEFIKLMLGKLKASEKITLTKAKKVRVTRDGDFTVQAEGELYQNLSLDAEIVSNRLTFYFP